MKFEFLEFVNDRSLLKVREDYHISNFFGHAMFLNTRPKSEGVYSRGQALYKIGLFDRNRNLIKTFNNPTEACKQLGLTRDQVYSASTVKFYTDSKIILRRVDDNGKVINAFKKAEKKIPVNRKPVHQFDLNMNLIKTHPSITDAAKSVGAERKYMRNHVRGTKSCKGFVFRFAEVSSL